MSILETVFLFFFIFGIKEGMQFHKSTFILFYPFKKEFPLDYVT